MRIQQSDQPSEGTGQGFASTRTAGRGMLNSVWRLRGSLSQKSQTLLFSVTQAPLQHCDLSENSSFLLQRFLVRSDPRGSLSRFSCVRCHTCPSECQVSPIKQEAGPNVAFMRLFHTAKSSSFSCLSQPLPFLLSPERS